MRIKIRENVETRQEAEEWDEEMLGVAEVAALKVMGVKDGDEVEMVEMETMFRGVAGLLKRHATGLVLFVYFDDYSWVLARDGKLLGAYYCSSRGALWQAEWKVVEGDRSFRANNLGDEKLEEGVEEESLGIAADFLKAAAMTAGEVAEKEKEETAEAERYAAMPEEEKQAEAMKLAKAIGEKLGSKEDIEAAVERFNAAEGRAQLRGEDKAAAEDLLRDIGETE